MKLKKGDREMEVRTGVQASAFLNSGWAVVAQVVAVSTSTEPVGDAENVKETAKRGRPAKTV